MSFIHQQTAQYPISERDIRALYPTRMWPTPFVAPAEYAWVFPAPQPEHDAITQSVRESAPALSTKGEYEQQWEVVALDEEQAATNLANAKEAKNAEINAARWAANSSAFTHAGKEFACDQLSRSDIDGTNGYVSLHGVLPEDWPGGWKAVDNTAIPIANVDAWKAFYGSMFAQGNANFARAQYLKGQLAQATTAAQIAAIQWAD